MSEIKKKHVFCRFFAMNKVVAQLSVVAKRCFANTMFIDIRILLEKTADLEAHKRAFGGMPIYNWNLQKAYLLLHSILFS